MKILFFNHILTRGGSGRVCADIANGLCKKGHQVIMLTNPKLPITYQLDERVKLIYEEKYDDNKLLTHYRTFLKLIKIFKEEKPDIVVVLCFYFSIEAKLASLISHHCPIVSSDHDSYEFPQSEPMGPKTKLHKFWFNYIFDHITVLTEPDKKIIEGRFKNVTVMPNPVTFLPLSEVPAKEKTVLAVGRINAWFYKGFDLLIGAWSKIESDCNDWKLKIVGSYDEEGMKILSEKANSLKRIEFVQFTPNIIEEYRKAAIFVLSSRYEGFGLVLTEAMSQGCACIACDYKGRQADIVDDGKSGLLCEVENADMLSEKIRLLIEDENLRKKLQNGAIHGLGKFDKEVVVDKWERLLNHIVVNYKKK